MYEDFANILHAIGWDNFVPIEEYGSRLLTIEFLCTLREVENGVYFRLFGKEYLLSWKTFAGHLFSTYTGLFLWTKLAEVLIVMSFGAGFWVKLSMASLHLGAAIFIIQLFN